MNRSIFAFAFCTMLIVVIGTLAASNVTYDFTVYTMAQSSMGCKPVLVNSTNQSLNTFSITFSPPNSPFCPLGSYNGSFPVLASVSLKPQYALSNVTITYPGKPAPKQNNVICSSENLTSPCKTKFKFNTALYSPTIVHLSTAIACYPLKLNNTKLSNVTSIFPYNSVGCKTGQYRGNVGLSVLMVPQFNSFIYGVNIIKSGSPTQIFCSVNTTFCPTRFILPLNFNNSITISVKLQKYPAGTPNGILLGSFVTNQWINNSRPQQNDTNLNTAIEINQTEILDNAIGRRLDIFSYYVGWNRPIVNGTTYWESDNGTYPMVSWAQGGTCLSMNNITNGDYDTLFTQEAQSAKAYGKLIFLRWFWEMNLPNVVNAPGCNYVNSTLAGPEYKAAWIHIWNIFNKVGANNVMWVWCPAGSHFSNATLKTSDNAALFYPGNKYVNWICVDLYDRLPTPQNLTNFQGYDFNNFYNLFGNSGKPIMFGETGALLDSAENQEPQVNWLSSDQKLLPTYYPAVRGLVYFDANATWDYFLTGAGLNEFKVMTHNPYFNLRNMTLNSTT